MNPVYYVKHPDGSFSEAHGGDLESRFLALRDSYQKMKKSNLCMYRCLLDVQLMLMSGQSIAEIHNTVEVVIRGNRPE